MNKALIIGLVAMVSIVGIVLVVIMLKPSTKAEESILSQAPVQQKNLVSDITGMIGSIYGK